MAFPVALQIVGRSGSLFPANSPLDFLLIPHPAFYPHAYRISVPPAVAQGLTGPAYEVSRWSGPVSAFGLVDTTGKTWRPADLQGRAVLLNFWASWCEPCRAEMPTLQQVADLYGPDKLLVLAINFKEPVARAIQFAKTTGVTMLVLLDVDGKAARQWGVKVFPTTLTIDSRGQPRHRVQGEVDWTSSAAEKLIAGLLKA
ncbi:TlpA family protein disulfide reductase [Polaromonas sp. JS666]|uniref:TlpA family protein disulfide reductase n=1 Tax=Polaromonas sp. (strain JS666 / ATCC BAA-500) TaxID=296591 RepID=UPI0000536056|nr:TlpA disulfide reductase family protein [Polaromonas sp. JS666]ABE44822.1 Thiol-disulfide isomerase and thioredoxins-like protein [Polaromonas sp. JS666]